MGESHEKTTMPENKKTPEQKRPKDMNCEQARHCKERC